MIFRVRFMTADMIPHVYCRIFVTKRIGMTWATIGSLTMRKEEFDAFKTAFRAEFIEEPFRDNE